MGGSSRRFAISCASLAIATGADFLRGIFRLLRREPLQYPEFGSQTIEKDDIKLVRRLLASSDNWGDALSIEAFQGKFREWNGSEAVFSFMSGRAALSACIHALSLEPGDEVVVPGYTCIVVPNAFAFAGITVRFCDIELDTFGPDIDSLKRAVTPKTKAVLVHHLYGLVARDFEAILNFAIDCKIHVIEDCAHATGAIFKGRRVGNWGAVGFYSTEQSKILSTFNGGIAVSNSPEFIEKLEEFHRQSALPDQDRTRKVLRSVIYHCLTQKSDLRWIMKKIWDFQYRADFLPSTSDDELRGVKPAYYRQRMSAPIAALALNQLSKADRFNDCRRVNAEQWREHCRRLGLPGPLVLADSEPVFLRYPVLVPDARKYDVDWCVEKFGVLPGHWFSGELHPVAKRLDGCPNAHYAVEHCINLPTLL